jgi:hypothetical protein
MNWIGQKLELQIIIVKPNLIIKDQKGSDPWLSKGSTLRSFWANLKSESRSDKQNNVIFRIAPINDPIHQKPDCLQWALGRIIYHHEAK